MAFIGKRRGWELGVSAPGLLLELAGGATFTKLSWTWEDRFMLQPLEKNWFWPRAWEILGQVQHLFCSKVQQS